MQGRLAELWQRIGAESTSDSAFKMLDVLYSDKNRFYHTWDHIKNCLDEFSAARHLAVHPNEVEFALWFHDAIYDTRAKDNEEQSALMAYHVCMVAGLSELFTERVKSRILVTNHIAIPENIDERLMVNTDLSILGKPAEEFDEYEKNIRKEYLWVPEEEYKKGRKGILQGFLDRPVIYSIDLFMDNYEEHARENLERAIKQLG